MVYVRKPYIPIAKRKFRYKITMLGHKEKIYEEDKTTKKYKDTLRKIKLLDVKIKKAKIICLDEAKKLKEWKIKLVAKQKKRRLENAKYYAKRKLQRENIISDERRNKE